MADIYFESEVDEGKVLYIFGYSQVSDFIPPSVRICRPNARTAAQELKELEATQECSARVEGDFIPPSVRVCRPNARTAAQELKELEAAQECNTRVEGTRSWEN